jgi:ketosteroid isomerase-like protein
LAEYERQLAKHDFDAVAPLISTEAIFWFNDGSHHGVHAIRKAFQQTFAAHPDERYWLEDVAWLAESESTAACVYRFRWTAHREGREFSGGGRGTTIMRAEPDGWRIVHEHLSREPD